MEHSASMALVASTQTTVITPAVKKTNVLATLFASSKVQNDQSALVTQIQDVNPLVAALMHGSEAFAQKGENSKASQMLVKAVNAATVANSLVGPTSVGMAIAPTPFKAYTYAQSHTPFAITSFLSSGSMDSVYVYEDATKGVPTTGKVWDGKTFTRGTFLVSTQLPPYVISNKMSKPTKATPARMVYCVESPSIDPTTDNGSIDNGRNYHGIPYASHTSKTLADTLMGLSQTPPTCLVLSTSYITTGELNKSARGGNGKAFAIISSGIGRVLAIDNAAANIDRQVRSCALSEDATEHLKTLLERTREHNTPLQANFDIDKTRSIFYETDYLRGYLDSQDPEKYPIRFLTTVQCICGITTYRDDTTEFTYTDAKGQPKTTPVTDIKGRLPETTVASGASDVIMIRCSVVTGESKKRKLEASTHSVVLFVSREHMFRSQKMVHADKSKVKSTTYADLVKYIKLNGVLADEFKDLVDMTSVSFIVFPGDIGEIHPEDMPKHLFDVKPAEPNVTNEENSKALETALSSNPDAINAPVMQFLAGTARKRIRFDVKPLEVLTESYLNMNEYDICDSANTDFAERIQMLGDVSHVQEALKFRKVDPTTDPCVCNLVYAAWMGAHAMSRCDTSPIHTIVGSFVSDVKCPFDAKLAIFWEATCFFTSLVAAVDTIALQGVSDKDRYICIDGYNPASPLLKWAESEAKKVHPGMNTKSEFYDSHIVKFTTPGYFMYLWDIGHRIYTNPKTKDGKTYAQILADTPRTTDADRVVELKAYFAKLWADAAPDREAFKQD